MDRAERMDPVGARLLQRIQGLLATRPDLKDRTIFGRRIGRPTPSWLSEFLNGKRTTNDLRLVLKIAKVFGVSVGYLLGESEPERERGRRDAAGDLRRDQRAAIGGFCFPSQRHYGLPSDEESGTGDGGSQGGGGNTTASNASPRKPKRR
jgi:transcriptional regulator with XRE-family HTH domain